MATKRNANQVRLLGMARRSRAALALTTALQASAMMVLSVPAMAQPPALAPNTQPQGGTTVAGSATITQNAAGTTIDQTSQRAALNWQSFSVGSQQTVTFRQPSSSAIALNRVVGPDPSQIAGRIDANGQVVLVNQSGVVFAKGAQVNAAALIVSTAGIATQNFMAGTMKFDRAGNPNARIENAGNITVKQAGLAALVAPQVANSGTISATLGHVVLAGAKTATLDMYGDGLVALDVTNQVTQVPVAADGTKATALVVNTGTIVAAGGTVQLTARAADGIVQTLVDAGGKIATPSLGSSTGTISVNAIGGTVVVDGQLSATGDTPGSSGGAVGVLATNGVGIAAGATIDVSGKTGGGVAAIGTTLARAKGGPSVANPATARNVVVQQGATIAANATVKGNGGRVTVLSSNVTHMDGAIAAKGGPQGGNGGFVEVSGNTLGMIGTVDLSAPHGTVGTLLLDPVYLDIDQTGQLATGTEDQNFFNNDGTVFANDGLTGTPDTIAADVLSYNDVLLQAKETISVNAAVDVYYGTLTLQAGSRITVNAGASVYAQGDITFQILPSLGTPNGTPSISILAPVVSNGSGVTLLASPGGSVNIGAAGALRAEETNVSIQADALTVASPALSIVAAGGSVEIAPATPGTQVTFAGPGGLEITQGFLNALNTTALQVGAVTLGGTLTTTAGTIAFAGPVTVASPVTAMFLNATGAVTQAAGAGLSVNSLSGTTGSVGLIHGTNTINGIGAYTVNGGDFAMTDSAALVVFNLTAAAGNVYLESASADGIAVSGRRGTIQTSTTGRASFQTDSLTVFQGASVNTGTFELAPDTLGAAMQAGTNFAASLAGITSNFVRFGAVTEPGNTAPTIRAGSVTIPVAFDFLNESVELDATGPIDASAGTLTNVATLSGAGTTWTLSATTNTVGNLGQISAGSFTLLDNIVLSVVGTLNATVSAAIDNTAGVTVAGAVKAPVISIQGTSLTIPGLVSDGGAGTVDFIASAGGISETGSVVAGTLYGNAAGTVALGGTNTVATLANFFAPSFTMSDTGDMTVSGTSGLRGGTNATIVDTGVLTVLTTVSANSIGLTAASIAIPGLVTDGGANGGNVALFATAGGINETGSILTTTLSGSATGAATLTGTNTVATLGNFSAAGFAFDDTGNLAIGGSTGIRGGASASITTSGSLAVNSSISATSVGLFATDGAIAETGTILAGTLTGSATGSANLTGTNTIGTVGNFTAAGFALTDSGNLAIAGTTGVSGGASAQMTTTGTLTVASTVNAASVVLTGAAIAIAGLVTDGGDGTVGLTATAGGIAETGTLISGDLSGGATGAVALTGNNTIANVGPFLSNGFTLFDTGYLAVGGEGTVSGGTSTVIVDTGTLTIYSTVGGTAISLTAASIHIYGLVTDGGAGTVALVATDGDVVEPFGEGINGEIVAGTLSGSATGSVDLEGFNTVAAVGNVAATSGFNLNDTIGLSVGGTTGIAGGTSAVVTTSGTLSVSSAIGGTSVDLTATSISIAGLVGAGTDGTVTVDTTTGDIAGAGRIVAGTFAGTVAGAVNLTGANTIATVGDFTVNGFTLHDTGNLTVAGTSGIAGGSGATIVDTGTLTVQTEVSAAAVGLTGAAIAIPGRVTDGGTGTVALVATAGTISETGVLIVGTLSGSATGTTSLTGFNTIAATGNFAGNGVTLDTSGNLAAGTGANGLNGGAGGATILDSGVLTVDGVFGTSVQLTADSIAIPGTLGTAASNILLAATGGGIAGAGTVRAATLAGSSTGATSLTGTNTIAALGNVSAAGFTLNDTGNLTVAGTTGISAGTSAAIATTGTLTITSTVSASAIGLTAGAIAETGSLVAATLSGSATGAATLTGSNTIGTVGNFTAAGFTLADTGNLTVGGTTGIAGGPSARISTTGTLTVDSAVAATAVALTGAALAIPGLVDAGAVALDATGGNIVVAGTLIAGALSGSATGSATLTGIANSIGTLNGFTAGGDLSLIDTLSLTVVGLVSAGTQSAPSPGNTATLALVGRGGLAIGVAGGASATLNAGTISLTANGTIAEANGTLAANDLTAQTNGTGGDILLASAANRIAASSGLRATNGDVVLVDDPTLTLTGAYSGNNLFFEVDQPGDSIAVGGATSATLTVPTAGRITLVADATTATATSTMTAPQGTIELAPFSAIGETVLGTPATGTLNLDATLLGVAGAGVASNGTLVLGAATGSARLQGGGTQIVRASSLVVQGTLSLPTTLGLLANGPIAESGGALAVGTLFANAGGGNVTLASPNNAIGTASGIVAGNIVLVDGTDLTLTGLHSANNAFYEVALAGGTLSVGQSGDATAQVQATASGRITLVADTIAAAAGSSIAATLGTVELAPFSAIEVGLLGTDGLVIGPTLLSAIDTGTLLVGGFTDAAAGATSPHVAAAAVSVDGTTDLTGIATTLVLDATGAISQPGGPLTVAHLSGTGSSVSLSNAANAIGSVAALSATAGNLSLADTGTLAVAGAVSATGNVYLAANEVALAAAGQIAAGATGLASIQADSLTLATGATIAAGTFEYAPHAAGATVTLGTGGALASLSGIDVGLARIGAVTLPGATTPTTTAGAIVVGGTFDAAGLNVELDATGAIAGTAAPLVNVGTLGGTGGAWTLTSPGNSVAALGAIVANGFQLNDSTALSVVGIVSANRAATISAAGTLTVAPSGAIDATAISLQADALTLQGTLNDGGAGTVSLVAIFDISQTGTLIAGTLSGSSANGGADFGGSTSVATLGDFAATGFTLADTRSLTVGGTLSAATIGLAATSLSLPGLVTDGGAGTVNLVATAGGIAQTGTLVAGTLAGSATGTVALGGTNTVATLGNVTAGSLALTDTTNLSISGTVTAPSISIHAPNGRIALAPGAHIVTGGTTRPSGAIVAADEPANGAPGASLVAQSFTQAGASFVTGTMQIGVTGNIAFDRTVGLQDPNGWLILNLTNGTATGDIFVRALDVSYTTPGSALLTGRIAGTSGQSAALLADITPATNLDFTFNGCIIGAVACTVAIQQQQPPPLPTPVVQTVPPQSPAPGNLALVPLLYTLQNVVPQVLLTPQDLDDLLQLPVVSEQDY